MRKINKELPCDIGDTLYYAQKGIHDNTIIEATVSMLTILSTNKIKIRVSIQGTRGKSTFEFFEDKIGTEYFYTKEEAENYCK